MRAAVVPTALLLLTVPLAGCLGGDDSAGAEPLSKARAQVTDATGGIEGVVTDNAVQPVVAAVVSLVELPLSATTADDGSFAFSAVPPGTYTLQINATGFVPASQQVKIERARVATIDFILVHLNTAVPYTQHLELAGYFECGVEVGFDVTPQTGAPLHQVDDTVNNTTALGDPGLRDAGYFFYGRSVCSAVNSVSANTTNDRFFHQFDLDAPLHTVAYAMVWTPNGPMASWMTTRMEVDPFYNTVAGTLFRVQGPSPIQVAYDRASLETTQAAFVRNCEEGLDDYCGLSFFDEGWPMVLRVFPAWQCQTETIGVCGVAQQPFTHYVSAFYNAPAPEGFSAVPA